MSILKRRHLVGAIAAGVVVGFGLPFSPAAPPAAPVIITILPESHEIAEGQALKVGFRVCNGQKEPLCVCTWPGLAVSFAWDEPDGSRSAVGRGYPDSRVLEAAFFVSIDPGKCYESQVVVDDLSAPPNELVTLLGKFRSDQTGSQHGFNCWRGSVVSEPVEIVVHKKQAKRHVH